MMPRSVCRCGATRHDRRDPPRVPLSSGESRGTTGGKEGPGGAERMAQPRRGVGVSGACACRRTSESGRGGEVLEVVTFVRWCGPVEPFPDDGRFDEPRAGGGPVTCGQRETCEPFERSCCHGRFAEPATQFQRLLVRHTAESTDLERSHSCHIGGTLPIVHRRRGQTRLGSQFSSWCLTSAMNWSPTAPSTTR